jgi:PPK2 family polyphosphate:nucleotide phosphotransferase
MNLRDRLRATLIDGRLTLASYDSGATPLVSGKDDAKDGLDAMADQLFDLHEIMFAHADRSVLLVLQGTDAAGKNGTIKHVVNRVNPAGVTVAEFDEPTEEEEKHHFLWRIEQQVPSPGKLGVFARSHFEDVIVPIAEETEDEAEIDSRFEDIVAFERELADGGTVVVKCLLHISYDEQRRRFLRRLRRHDKRWKFDEGDIATRRKWDQYQLAMGETVARTHTDEAPWYIIPADNKWYRNWAIARILVETWEDWNLDYPAPDLDLEALREALDD